MRTHRRSWLKRRFVFLSEVLGYCLSGAIFVGLIVTLFIRVDITVNATTELQPTCHDVTHPEDFLIVEYLAANGASVTANQPIARVLLDPVAQQRDLTRRQLLDSVSQLEDNDAEGSAAALIEMKRALAILPPSEDSESIISSWDGVLLNEGAPRQSRVVPGGTALARVCDFHTLEMRARIGDSNGGDDIAVGQRARVFIKSLDALMVGEVAEVHRDEPNNVIRLEFSEIPSIVQDHFFETFVGDPNGDPLVLQADIIVGSRSLFMEMFGRGEHAK